jgi:hypothetical protein
MIIGATDSSLQPLNAQTSVLFKNTGALGFVEMLLLLIF